MKFPTDKNPMGKLVISDEIRKSLEEHKAELSNLLAKARRATKAASELEAMQTELNAVLQNGEESIDATDTVAIQDFATKSVQQRLIGQQIGTKTKTANEAQQALREKLEATRGLVIDALTPDFEKELDRVTGCLLPFFLNRSGAQAVARETPYLSRYLGFMRNEHGSYYNPSKGAEKFLQVIESLLKGERVYQFATPSEQSEDSGE